MTLAILVLGSKLASAGALHVDGQRLRDAEGATVILRGVNVAGNSKVPPFRGITSAADLDPLPRLGMNVVRLLFTWEAYEPTLGNYDADYLAYYVDAVKAAAARGLYVIVDFHEDGYSRFALDGCGEGFPAWALPASVAPAVPDNGAACADWGTRMLADASLKTCWNDFYADAAGVRTRYLAMIARVATALAGEPMVVGYDPMNEPGGDEPTQLAPFYEAAAQALRAVDGSAILFVSPAAVTSAGTQTALPKPSFGNFVYAPHFYDPTLVAFGAWQGDDEHAAFDRMTAIADAWGVPLLVGEYGGPATSGDVDGYVGALTAQLARTLASGTQWVFTPHWDPTTKDGWNREDYSIVDDTGALRANFRPRPYARRIAGTPTAMTYVETPDGQRNAVTLTWQNAPALGATELFAPAAWFGGEVAVDEMNDVQCERASDVVTCTSKTAGEKTVHLAPASRRCGLTGAEGLLLLMLRRRRRGVSRSPRWRTTGGGTARPDHDRLAVAPAASD